MSEVAAIDDSPASSSASQASDQQVSPPQSRAENLEFSRQQKQQLAEIVALAVAEVLDKRRDGMSADKQAPPPDPLEDPNNFVDWSKWAGPRFRITPRADQRIPDHFNLHGEPTHDSLVDQKRTAAQQEFGASYCGTFFSDAGLRCMEHAIQAADQAAAASTDPLFGPFFDQMCTVYNTIRAATDIVTARMTVVQVSAAAGRGEFTPGYAEYVAQRAQATSRTEDLFNAEHRTWYADYLKQHSDQAVKQLARTAISATIPSSSKSYTKTTTTRPKLLKKAPAADSAHTPAAEDD